MSRARRIVVLRAIAVSIVVLLLAGIFYEQLGRRRDRQRFPRVGSSVDVGGRTLNIFSSGAGGPAVVLETASGVGLEWDRVQSEAAKLTRTCWYDRAGMGWSDPGPYPRTAEAIAKDLHALLERANISPPFVLAGFSFGGLPLREYAQ